MIEYISDKTDAINDVDDMSMNMFYKNFKYVNNYFKFQKG